MLRLAGPVAGAVIAAGAFAWGFASGTKHVFPYETIRAAERLLRGSPPPPPLPPLRITATPQWPPVQAAARLSCRPAAAPLATAFGNNHDVVYLPGPEGSAFAHYLLVSGNGGQGQLYGSDAPTAGPEGWTLVEAPYFVADHYELDDAILIGTTHYIFEAHRIYALDGDPATGSHRWREVGRFPPQVDDVAVYFDGETVHLFGEHGDYPGRPDGATIAYYTAPADFSAWSLVNTAIANPNVFGAVTWGVGDPSLMVTEAGVVMVTDIETDEVPYRLALWQAGALGQSFDFAGILAAPAPGTDGLYNHRVQDGEFLATGEEVLMFANWRDIDGNPGRRLEGFGTRDTRVIGGYRCRWQGR